MKLLTTLLLALLAGLGVYAARRRIWLALRTGAVVYVALLALRLAFAAGSLADRLDELVGPAVGLLVVWAALWWLSTSYERRKRAPRATAGPPPAGGRGKGDR